MLVVEFHDLRQDRKRGVVHDHAVGLVRLFCVVAAGVEWPHEPGPLHAVPARHPFGYCVIYDLRRVAVVRCLFRLELLYKIVVLVVPVLFVLPVLLLPVKPVGSLRLEVEQVPGVEPFQVQRLALLFNLLPVPTGQLRRAVVPDGVVPALRVRQVVQADARDLVHVQLNGGDLPPVALHDQVIVAPNANRVVKPVHLDALFDLLDVLRAVLAGVPLIRCQVVRGQVNDLQFLHALLLRFKIKKGREGENRPRLPKVRRQGNRQTLPP